MRATLLILIGIMGVTSLLAAPFAIFEDLDTLLRQSEEIIIAESLDIGKEQGGRITNSDVRTIMILKGNRKEGARIRVSTPSSSVLSVGNRYLLLSGGGQVGDADFVAVGEFGVIQVPDEFKLEDLNGLPLKDQIISVIKSRKTEIDLLLTKLQDERKILEKAVGDDEPATRKR